ncbi:hypothetical protein EMCG_05629 [[Emmonsia] crescens]|uniref:Uncharacterized protein n=1 Tax=[Emmonsia] crescens TaxID=73230 RepID=A0A0G2IDK1_9EURO|nr:hypothetical protein EMCG_05629 [Emmonsia crescens UAMH 3008]
MLSHSHPRPPSPPETQNTPPYSAADSLRSWLSEHGVGPNEVDRLWTRYNKRQHNLDREYPFLSILKDVVAARKSMLVMPTDVNEIDVDFEGAIQTRNSQLQEQADRAVASIYVDTVRLLPDNLRHYFLNFLKSDSINDRLLFLTNVLTWMTGKLKRKRSDDSDEGVYEEQKQQRLKKIHTNQRETRIRNIQNPRRSKRLAAKRSANN